MIGRPRSSTLFPSPPLFRSGSGAGLGPASTHTTSEGFRNRHSGPPWACCRDRPPAAIILPRDRKSTRLNSSHSQISYAVFCLKKKDKTQTSRGAHHRPACDG